MRPPPAGEVRRSAQPPSEPSEEKTRPSAISPFLSAALVSGPPGSSDLKSAIRSTYLLVRPGWQNGRVGHSGGPPSTMPLHVAASSVNVVTWCLSAKAFVTANAFTSCAAAGLPKVRPAVEPSVVRAATLLVRSGLACGAALAQFAFLFRKSV